MVMRSLLRGRKCGLVMGKVSPVLKLSWQISSYHSGSVWAALLVPVIQLDVVTVLCVKYRIVCFSFQVQCTKPDCGKWRQLTKEIQLTASLAATYRCGMKFSNIKVKRKIKIKTTPEMIFSVFLGMIILFVCHRVRDRTSARNQRTW